MDLSTFLIAYRDRAPRIMWLLGAGASTSAGIPSAEDMTWDFKRSLFAAATGMAPSAVGEIADAGVRQRLQAYFDGQGSFPPLGAEEEYSLYFERVRPDEDDRRAYLDNCLQKAHPSEGHLALARLLLRRYARVIWTTNFDGLVESAWVQSGGPLVELTPVSLETAASAKDALANERWPLVVKLHGDVRYKYLKNVRSELSTQAEAFAEALFDASRRFGLVVVGYSGRDRSVMAMLERALETRGAFQQGLFWCHRGPKRPLPAVEQLLEKARAVGTKAELIEIDSFDQLATALATHCDCPPDTTTHASTKGGGDVYASPLGTPPGGGLAISSAAPEVVTSILSGALVAQVGALSTELARTAAEELVRKRAAWREGHRIDVRQWVEGIGANRPALSLPGELVAAQLRFAAGVILDDDGNLERAGALLDQARAIDPSGEDARPRAMVLVRKGDVAGAHTILLNSAGLGARNMRASLHLQHGNLEAADQLLGLSDEGGADEDIAEAWRLRALVRFGRRDLAGALSASRSALALRPGNHQARHLLSALLYHEGVTPALVPMALPPWPRPIDPSLLRRDPAATAALLEAARGFGDQLQLDLTQEERRCTQAWQLAALANCAGQESATATLAEAILSGDPGHPYVLIWMIVRDVGSVPSGALEVLASEIEDSHNVNHALVYAGAAMANGEVERCVAHLTEWKPYFESVAAMPAWTYWRARVALAQGDIEQARALRASIDGEPAQGAEVAILAETARATGDTSALLAHLEKDAKESSEPYLLLEACEIQARAGQWSYVRERAPLLLEALPIARVHRLAAFAYLHTGALAECADLLEQVLASDTAPDELREMRLLRSEVHRRRGRVPEAIVDLAAVVASDGERAATRDLMMLARLHFMVGRVHDVAALAQRLLPRTDLAPEDALVLAGGIALDDGPLARDLWLRAEAQGLPDDAVPAAIALGYRLSLDERLGGLTRRMAVLAEAGHDGVRPVTIDELITMQKEWATEHERLLALYRRGEQATHVVAEFLNLPGVHLYHVLPASNETAPSRRGLFALQLRDGGRELPKGERELASPGRLALDLSGLLMAAHLDILPLLEAELAPLMLHEHALAVLREQRDSLAPHQPSRWQQMRELVQAERRGWLHRWEGPLPPLTETDRILAGNWAEWVALLERARLEGAWVLDLPFEQEEGAFGRPVATTGPERLARLITVDGVRRSASLGDTRADWTDAPETTLGASGLRSGDRVYLTEAGAEALERSGLLREAAERFALYVDPDSQDARRAHLDTLEDTQAHIAWVEALVHRVSQGLEGGRYALLPANAARVRDEGRVAAEAENAGFTEPTSGGSVERDAVDKSDAVPTDNPKPHRTRRVPPALQMVADLVQLPAGTVDAVWIDDRWLNRHRFAGAARVTETVEVLAWLRGRERLSPTEHWAKMSRLRAANVRIIPLSSEEILHHLGEARVEDRRLIETPALRILRQSAAAFVEDAQDLHVPAPARVAAGEIGDLEATRLYVRATHDALLALWKGATAEDGRSVETEVVPRARWLAENLYLDMGLLRSTVDGKKTPPHYSVSATGAAALLAGAMQLLDVTEHNQHQVGDLRARAFAGWVYRTLLAERMKRDPAFGEAVVAQLKRMLMMEPEAPVVKRPGRLVARVLAGRTYDALPQGVQDALADDAAFMKYVGRGVVVTVTVGKWEIPLVDLARAGVAAREGGDGSVLLPGEGPRTTVRISWGEDGFPEVDGDDGKTRVRLGDAAFRVLTVDPHESRKALQAMRSAVDVSEEAWTVVVERLLQVPTPVERLQQLLELRQSGVATRYEQQKEDWKAGRRVKFDDFTPPSGDSALNHLRLRPELVSAGGMSEALAHAGATLVEEEGLREALARLSALPVPLPPAVVAKVRALPRDERRALVVWCLQQPGSPIATMHAIRLGALLAEDEPAYRPLLRRVVRTVATPAWDAWVELLRECAERAYDELPTCDEDPAARAGSLVATWLHATHVVTGLLAAGVDAPVLLNAMESQGRNLSGRLFASPDPLEGDAGHPLLVCPARFALAGFQYASADTHLFDQDMVSVEEVVERLTQAVSGNRLPKAELLTDLSGLKNVLGVWLVPRRDGSGGGIVLGDTVVVPDVLGPQSVRGEALRALESDPGSVPSWRALEMVMRTNSLEGTEAERFADVVGRVDLNAIPLSQPENARLIVGRIVRQAVASGSEERREAVRERLLGVVRKEREAASRSQRTGGPRVGDAGSGGAEGLSPTQLAVLEGLFLLSRGETSREQAIAVFANDLKALGQLDGAFLCRSRIFLETLVADFPLAEALAFVGLLAESRGS